MIDLLRTLGLTDWSSFCWGIGVSFGVAVVLTGLVTLAFKNAPLLDENGEHAHEFIVMPWRAEEGEQMECVEPGVMEYRQRQRCTGCELERVIRWVQGG